MNLLTALLWPTHEHHGAAHRWFGARSGARWATSAHTQLGFVRLVSNPAFSRDALSAGEAIALLAENLAHPAHEFWSEDVQVAALAQALDGRIGGHRQLTDGYLLVLASRRRGVLATFDRGLRQLATPRLVSALEVVQTS